ncbi:Serine/threonine-protein kinase haspin like protein hrk1 [Dictyocoela roeselum]|nr:Serine/threonine-protein kinase haspin like protein hrk1 [Dictyocoela roeselum]
MKIKTCGKDSEEIINSTYNDIGKIIKKLKLKKNTANKEEYERNTMISSINLNTKMRILIDIPLKRNSQSICDENINYSLNKEAESPDFVLSENICHKHGDLSISKQQYSKLIEKASNNIKYNENVYDDKNVQNEYFGNLPNDSELGNALHEELLINNTSDSKLKNIYFRCPNYLETPDRNPPKRKIQIRNKLNRGSIIKEKNNGNYDPIKPENTIHYFKKHKILKFKNITIKIERIIPDNNFLSLLCPSLVDFKTLGSENVVKIGEASYSEVFCLKGCAYKIIPISHDINNFCKEAYINKILSGEKGILRIKEILILRGKYPQNFLRAWNNYDKRNKSENINPIEYDDYQIYGVIAMERKQHVLEHYKFKNKKDVVHMFCQLLKILGKLEEKYKFEHRDLHWGNILIDDKNGLEVFIIDFTLSRLSHKGIIYTDLKKDSYLFEGDENVDSQYKVYRDMQECNNNVWDIFNPYTNVLWVKYLFEKFDKYQSSLEELKCAVSKVTAISKMLLKIEE